MANFTEQDCINWLRLIRSENIGPKTFQDLLRIYGSADKALEAAPRLSLRGGKNKPIKLFSTQGAEQEIENAGRKGAKIIASCQKEYPPLLKQIKDYPPIITVYGNLDVLTKNSIAIVGARNSSANGCRFAEKIARELGEEGFVVTSGLARGIDTAAHKGSLKTGTIAVVAGGIDKIYPPENKDLFNQIGKTGAVITEIAFGCVPVAQSFPRRNRIISGISLGTIVVEANLRSGSLITARMALEHDREVFAVPGSPLDPRCQGTNKLIKDGAHLIEKTEDVLDVIRSFSSIRQAGLFEQGGGNFAAATNMPLNDAEIDKARPQIIEKIGASPTPVDEIIAQTGFNPNIVLTILLELELAGRLDRHIGNKVSLIYCDSAQFDEVG